MRTSILLAVYTVLVALPASLAAADVLQLKNGDLIECKYVRREQLRDRFKRVVEYIVVSDENGKERKFKSSDIDSLIRTSKTSWEKRAEREAWYKEELPKVEDTWKLQARFARKCASRGLDNQAAKHYLRAFTLRRKETPEEESELLTLARWAESRCELYEEAEALRVTLYVRRKAALKVKADAAGQADEDKARSARLKAHLDLAAWCKRLELVEAQVEQLEAVVALDPNHRAARDLARLRRRLLIPVTRTYYATMRKKLEEACKYLRKKQARDGSIGSDVSEAGVHGQRGMSALSGMALLAEWDFAVLYGKDESAETTAPKPLLDVIKFVTDFKVTSRLRGDDVWGPIFALDFLVSCYENQRLAAYRESLKREITELIVSVKKLQRPNGGWYYYSFTNKSASFVAATAVLSLLHAKQAGFTLPAGIVEKGLDNIASQKQGQGTYAYFPNTTQGSIGACARSPLCELALNAGGRSSPENLARAIKIFFQNRAVLVQLKGSNKTHVGKGKTAPYYLLYAHYFAARAIKYLPAAKRRAYLSQLKQSLLSLQDRDKTYSDWTGTKDYKVYGTALAALTMYHIANARPEVGQRQRRQPGLAGNKADGPLAPETRPKTKP